MRFYILAILLFTTQTLAATNEYASASVFDNVKLTPQEAAEQVVKNIMNGDDYDDEVYSGYFSQKIKIQTIYNKNESYTDCMFWAAKLIAATEYQTISNNDILQIKQKAFDNYCFWHPGVKIQNKYLYNLMYNKCLTSSEIQYRHFITEKYEEFLQLKHEFFVFSGQILEYTRQGLPLPKELDEQHKIFIKQLDKIQDEFMETNLEPFSPNNKRLWCDCFASAFALNTEGKEKSLEKYNSFSKLSDILTEYVNSNFIHWNISAHVCYMNAVQKLEAKHNLTDILKDYNEKVVQ